MQPHSKENVSSFPATKLDIRLVRNQLQLLVRVLGLLCWVAQCGRVGDKGAAGGLAEHDSGGAQADAGGGSTGAGRESAEVSALKGYKLEGFSVERLMHFAMALEHDMVIEIRPRASAEGVATVMVVGAA